MRISSVNVTKSAGNLFTELIYRFTEEIFNGKLDFLCSAVTQNSENQMSESFWKSSQTYTNSLSNWFGPEYKYKVSNTAQNTEIHLISLCGNIVETYSFRIVSVESPESMRKLCLSTKFPNQDMRWNSGILSSTRQQLFG